MKTALTICLAGLLCLAGCASPGAPQPPSLQLPKPVDDLTATRKGNSVLLTWTPATQTSDGENLRHAGATEICRSSDPMPLLKCGRPVAEVKDAQIEHYTRGSMVARHDYNDTLPTSLIQQNPTGFATYALEDQNTRGKSAGLSNQVKVSLAPTLPAPSGVDAKVLQDGVLLGWTGVTVPAANPALSYLYRVFRQSQGGEKTPEAVVGEVPVNGGAASYLDRNIQWEQNYVYRIAPITRVRQAQGEPIEVEGDDSPQITAFAHDVFPPAAPSGLQAVFSGVGQKPFIDLTWAPNLESDLAGYDVYRHEAGTPPAKVNSELVKTPSFRDSSVEPGHQYFYAVAAVDARSNESGRSEEASERVPNQQ
jgi:hypothetical protein